MTVTKMIYYCRGLKYTQNKKEKEMKCGKYIAIIFFLFC